MLIAEIELFSNLELIYLKKNNQMYKTKPYEMT